MSIKKIHLGAGIACALAISGLATAATHTPITDDRTALRSILSGVDTAFEVMDQVTTFSWRSQDVIDQGLQMLAAATTPADLAAAGSIDVPCSKSGTLRARMAASWPRVVRFEWIQCARDFFGTVQTLNGPGEVVLVGTSFTPTTIAGLRLGDRLRDVTVDSPIVGSTTSAGSQARLNVRFVGVLPMTRAYEFGPFVGRYAYQVDGFHETRSFYAAYPDPGPPFYAQVSTNTAEGVLVAGDFERDAVTASERHDNRILRGTFARRLESATTPTRAGRTYTASIAFQNVRSVYRLDYPPQGVGRLSISIDGKAETNFGSYYGFKGCSAPETWTWSTPQPLSYDFNNLLSFPDRGELVANGKASGKFAITGTEYDVDQLGHLDIAVRGLGTFNFSDPYDLVDLAAFAGCSP